MKDRSRWFWPVVAALIGIGSAWLYEGCMHALVRAAH
jgi:hypothetical protein